MDVQNKWRDEGEQIKAAQAGDQEAFEELVDFYQPMLFNTAYRILGDGDSAADATQETLLSAYRALKTFRGGSFKAWLLRIVTNVCYDQLRWRKRRPTTSLDVLLESCFVTTPTNAPEDHVIRRDLSEAIQRGLDSLGIDNRTAVVLSDIDGLSYAEIADIVDAPLGTIKSRICRGRVQLRDYLVRQDGLIPALR